MRFIPLLTAATIAIAQLPSLAFGRFEVPFDRAERGIDVKVTPEGVSIDLAEGITAITISDRRQILVRRMGNSIYLQRVKTQKLDGMLGSADGSSVLRVWTASGKQLRFRLVVGNSGGKDIVLVPSLSPVARAPKVAPLPIKQASKPVLNPPVAKAVAPTAEEPFKLLKPLATIFPIAQPVSFPVAEPIEEPQPKVPIKEDTPPPVEPPVVPPEKLTPASEPKLEIRQPVGYSPNLKQLQAKAILRGLVTAKLNKQVGYQSTAWNKTQDVIYLLKRGKSLDAAIKISRSDRKLIEKFLKDGGFAS